MSVHKLQRNAAVFEAVARGASLDQAAEQGCVVKERARQIVHATCKAMLDPARLGNDVAPRRDHATMQDFRENAEFWLRQLDKWRKEHGLKRGKTP